MNENFTLKGNRDSANKVLRCTDAEILDTFNAYTNLRFGYFKPTQDILRKVDNQNKSKFYQERKQTDKKFTTFYDNYCSEFHFGSNDDYTAVFEENEHIYPWQPKELYDNIRSTNVGKTYFLVGEVGCGKSTYISSLIRQFDKHNTNGQQGLLVFVIKFSKVEEFGNDETSVERTIINLLIDALNLYLKKSAKIKYEQSAEDFIQYCMNTYINHKLVFIFDDIDTIYDQYAKNLFSYTEVDEQYDDWQSSKKKSNILPIISKLIEITQKFSGENIDFIMSLRPNSYNIAAYTGHGVSNQQNNCIFLKTNKNSLLQENGVIDKRIKMWQEKSALINIKCIKDNFDTFVNVSMKHKLHGLRHFIDNSAPVFAKNMESQREEWMFEMFTYLDNQNIYTQNRWGGIINIFLVNSQYRKDEDRAGSPEYPKYPKYIKEKHCHTYWLKYLISCIFHRTHSSDDIMYDGYFKNYERHIYQLCIYSLTEVQHGRLISCVPDKERGIPSLKLTDRLEYCVGEDCRNLFFKFTYIAVVIDDAYLQIPNVIPHDDLIHKCHIYKSFFPDNESETQEWQEWLKKSIHKVFLFMKILKISWEHYEEKRILDGLKRYKPDFHQIHEEHCREISTIAQSLQLDNIEAITKQIIEEQKKYDDALIDFYSSLYSQVNNSSENN
jgi:ABC-type dipeptide/oligopeptide/nickel transport system ATPase component